MGRTTRAGMGGAGNAKVPCARRQAPPAPSAIILRGAFLLAAGTLGPLGAGEGRAQVAEPFDGAHFGAGLASQNVWGGSFVDGVDVLSQDRRTVLELSGGWRKQFGRFVGGVELQYGFFDGSLSHGAPADELTIAYEGDRQFGYGLTAGTVIGAGTPTLVFAYAAETTRTFDVTVNESDRTFEQTDEQGFLRYGIGVEARLWNALGFRGAIGTYRVDFGDLVTNIDVGADLEYTIGLVYQLGG